MAISNGDQPAAGVVSSWGFNETSGNDVRDGKGLSDGTGDSLERDLDSLTDGGVGRSTGFDGARSAVAVRHVDDWLLTEYSVRLYFQADTLPATDQSAVVLVDKDDGLPPGGFSIELYNDRGTTKVRVMVRDATGGRGSAAPLLGTRTIAAKTAHRVVLTLSATDGAKLYVDGGRAEAADATRTHGLQTNRSKLSMGAYAARQGFFDGVIDSVALYSGALVQTEVEALAAPRNIAHDELPEPPPIGFPVPQAVDSRFAHKGDPNQRYNARGNRKEFNLVGPKKNAFFGYVISGAANGCWSGGSVRGTQSRSKESAYDNFGNSKAFLLRRGNSRFLIEGLRIDNFWDGIVLAEGGTGTTIRAVWATWCHDDFLENDHYFDGVLIDDCLLDHHFMVFSARDNGEQPNRDNFTQTIKKCLCKVGIMPIEPGRLGAGRPNPGTGYYFKLNERSPKFDIFDSIFWIEQGASTGKSDNDPGVSDNPLYELKEFDKLRNSRGNLIVWAGEGGFPSRWWVPPGFTVTTDVRVWSKAVENWKASHPEIARIPGVDD